MLGDALHDCIDEAGVRDVFEFEDWIDYLRDSEALLDLDDRYGGTYYVPTRGGRDAIIAMLREYAAQL